MVVRCITVSLPTSVFIVQVTVMYELVLVLPSGELRTRFINDNNSSYILTTATFSLQTLVCIFYETPPSLLLATAAATAGYCSPPFVKLLTVFNSENIKHG